MGCLILGIFYLFFFVIVAGATSSISFAIGFFLFLGIISCLCDEEIRSNLFNAIGKFFHKDSAEPTKPSTEDNSKEVSEHLEAIEKLNVELAKVDENMTEAEAEKLLKTLRELNKRLEALNEASKN